MSAKKKLRVMIELEMDAPELEPGKPVNLTDGDDTLRFVDYDGDALEVSETIVENGRKFLVLRERSDA